MKPRRATGERARRARGAAEAAFEKKKRSASLASLLKSNEKGSGFKSYDLRFKNDQMARKKKRLT